MKACFKNRVYANASYFIIYSNIVWYFIHSLVYLFIHLYIYLLKYIDLQHDIFKKLFIYFWLCWVSIAVWSFL